MTHQHDLLTAIKAAQSSPAHNYVLAARLGDPETGADVALFPCQIANTINPQVLTERLQGEGRAKLAELGHELDEISACEIFLGLLPDAKEFVDEAIDHHAVDEILMLDFLHWEAFKLQTGLASNVIDGQDEIAYRGIRIWRSAVR